MFTLQTNNEIRINKGDSGMSPLFINIGDSLRPIGYSFAVPIEINTIPEIDITFYEDVWRDKVIESGSYVFIYSNNVWTLNAEEVDLSDYGISYEEGTLIENNYRIEVTFTLLDNDSKIYFEMWPILQDPEVPLFTKMIYPHQNKIEAHIEDNLLYEKYINTVNSYGEIILTFYPEDTEYIERGKYLYQLRAYLYDKYNDKYDIKTIINRTPFYVIDDNFTERIW